MNFSRSKPGKGLQDHMIHLCLVFQRTSVLFPLTASPVPFPPRLWEESLVCTSSAVLFFEDLFHKATVISVRSYLIVVWWHWFNNYWCWVSFPVFLLFYTLWVQFTSWNWLLETWSCLEFFSHYLLQDVFWGQVSFTALSYLTIKSSLAPVLWFPCWFIGKESTCNAGDLQETWVQSLVWEDPLEKEMATHSSILAWRLPWTKEPGGLQSMRSQSQTQPSD